MLEVRPVAQNELNGLLIADQVLCGDEVTVRVGYSGFSLSYQPSVHAQWRVFHPTEEARLWLLHEPARCGLFSAIEDRRVVGIALIAATQNGWAELCDIRVDVQHRRQGTGTALLNACAAFSESRKMGGMHCAVPDSNPVMCQFLEHHGFQVHGLDRMSLSLTDSERAKPLQQRACLLHFYRREI